jgi:hypothetical protein
MDRPLHPNLARIAAAYDEVMELYHRGQLAPVEARRRVLALVARDDNGLEWSIDPDTGHWRYRSHFGELVTAEPPSFGVAGFTPGDLGAGRPDSDRVTLFEIDQQALVASGQLRGSTMLTGGTAADARRSLRWRRILVVVTAVTVVIALAATLL